MAATHGRRQLRLPRWDYSTGTYFVTMSAVNSADMFGRVVGREMQLNEFGRVVAESWGWLQAQYQHVVLDEWCVMPTHMHGILVLTTEVARKSPAVAQAREHRKPLGQIVGAFKTRSTKEVNRLRHTPGKRLWQRNYWESLIRDEFEMSKVRAYIRGNVAAYGPRMYTVTLP